MLSLIEDSKEFEANLRSFVPSVAEAKFDFISPKTSSIAIESFHKMEMVLNWTGLIWRKWNLREKSDFFIRYL